MGYTLPCEQTNTGENITFQQLHVGGNLQSAVLKLYSEKLSTKVEYGSKIFT